MPSYHWCVVSGLPVAGLVSYTNLLLSPLGMPPGPALRELTFHQRAGLLKSLGTMLREHREELYALSARAGATLADARFDVDGGIGVLLSYASKARRELPNDTVLAEGAVDATLLAVAGLQRLGAEAAITTIMPAELMLPAPAQGTIAVEARRDDRRAQNWLAMIDHAPTAAC